MKMTNYQLCLATVCNNTMAMFAIPPITIFMKLLSITPTKRFLVCVSTPILNCNFIVTPTFGSMIHMHHESNHKPWRTTCYVATASFLLGMLKTRFQAFKCFLRSSPCVTVPAKCVVTLQVSLMTGLDCQPK